MLFERFNHMVRMDLYRAQIAEEPIEMVLELRQAFPNDGLGLCKGRRFMTGPHTGGGLVFQKGHGHSKVGGSDIHLNRMPQNVN